MANTNDACKITYTIVGRYINGSAVSAYHVLSSDGKEFKASRELVCYLVGKGVVTNCKGQMNGGDVVLRGVGINLTELPVKNERTGEITNTQSLGSVKPRDTSDSGLFTQLMIVARIFKDNKCVGYVVRNAGGIEKKLERSVVMKLAADKKIGNARINMVNGTPILRGVGVELDKLPVIQLSKSVNNQNTKAINNTQLSMPLVKLYWYEIELIINKLEKFFKKDEANNASSIYQYPVIELMDAHSSTMSIITDKDNYKITQLKRGSDEGIEFVLASVKNRVKVVCEDISVLVFNIHVLGFMAMTALLKLYKDINIREFIFENKLDRLLWREHCTVPNINTFKVDKSNSIEVTAEDTVKLTSKYDIALSLLSSLGIKKRYPTISMVASKDAVMCVNTSNGYYEVGRIKLGLHNNVGIAFELINKISGEKHVITHTTLDLNKVTAKNMSILCCAALMKINPSVDISEVLIENELEQSVVGFTFDKKEDLIWQNQQSTK